MPLRTKSQTARRMGAWIAERRLRMSRERGRPEPSEVRTATDETAAGGVLQDRGATGPFAGRFAPLSGFPLARASRRTMLSTALSAGLGGTLLGGAVLGGCSDDAQHRRASIENRLRKRAGRDTAALIAAYDATIETHPELSEKLRPLRADLVRHAEAFGRGTVSASPSPSASPAPQPSRVPKDPGRALRALADAEQRAGDARTEDLAEAPPELARLLASVAASGAGHALLLRS